MTPVTTFLWGAAGSVAAEIVSFASHYDEGGLELPARYRRVGFYIARVLLAIIGGGLAVGYGVTQPILAGHIGLATPLIVRALKESVPAGVHVGSRAPARRSRGAQQPQQQ